MQLIIGRGVTIRFHGICNVFTEFYIQEKIKLLTISKYPLVKSTDHFFLFIYLLNNLL